MPRRPFLESDIPHFASNKSVEDYMGWIPISIKELKELESRLTITRVKCIVSPEEMIEFDLNSDFSIPQHLYSPKVQWYRWGYTD